MIFNLIILLTITFSTLAHRLINDITPTSQDNKELLEYAEKVAKIGDFNLATIESIKFFDGSKNRIKNNGNITIGLCEVGFTSKIFVNNEWWSTATDREKTILIAHEIYHCVCDLEHIETLRTDTCPKTYMYPTVPSIWCIQEHYNTYHDQISKGCKFNGK